MTSQRCSQRPRNSVLATPRNPANPGSRRLMHNTLLLRNIGGALWGRAAIRSVSAQPPFVGPRNRPAEMQGAARSLREVA